MPPSKKDKRLLPMGSCRTRDKKDMILDSYKLREIFHGISLDDDIRGCCEKGPLKEFHIFEFQIRKGNSQPHMPKHGAMYVGSHCGREFRKLMTERGEAHDWPAFRSPFKSDSGDSGTKRSTGGGRVSIQKPRITKEAELVLTFMIAVFPTIAENPRFLMNMFEKIRKNPQRKVLDREIKGINTAIGVYLNTIGITQPFLTVVQNRIIQRGETPRTVQLTEIKRILARSGQQNNIC